MASLFGNLWDFLFKDTELDTFNIAKGNVKRNNFSSIAAKATEGILQFPVVVSNTIDNNSAVLVTKACERSYASFAKVVFSMHTDIRDNGARNVSDYLSTFHQNKGLTSIDSDVFESWSFGDETGHDKTLFTINMYCPEKPLMVGLLKEQMKPYIENFCLTNLNDLYSPKRISSSPTTINMEGYFNPSTKKITVTEDFTNSVIHNHEDGKKRKKLTGVFGQDGGRVFSDADVRKANEMQPTFIKLNVVKVTGDVKVDYDITIGIKCTLHPVSSEEFISNMVDACEYKGTLFRFIRWDTGEIEFLRDFVLRMDEFKKETKNRVNGNSSWWEALRRRAREAKVTKVSSDRLLPNTTFVINKTEIDAIKGNYGYDLTKEALVIKIMKEYFLLGFAIVDLASETVDILFDGQKKFQTYTFAALEREGGSSERQFKEILRSVRTM